MLNEIKKGFLDKLNAVMSITPTNPLIGLLAYKDCGKVVKKENEIK